MPELPEVETTLRGISPHVVGKTIRSLCVRQPQLRWLIPANLADNIVGKKVRAASRRGKYLILAIGDGHLLIHLGMSGSLRIVAAEHPVAKHDHVDITLPGKRCLRFTDPRRFGAILWADELLEEHPLLAHLGPEPLTEDFTAALLFQATRKRKQAIKTLIMDSKIVVGVGNIYANEALFMAGIRPRRAAKSLSQVEVKRLVEKIKFVLNRSVEQGGTTLRDFVGGDGKPGYFKQQLQVYGRENENCHQCHTALKSLRLGQRATVYCPECQQ